MELIMILGPMKSGKSFEMISYFMPLKHTDIKFGLYQPTVNTRNEEIWSRNGISLKAEKVKSLRDIEESDYEIIGIDEMHMFEEEDSVIIERLLKKDKKVIVSGLDTDYRGKIFPIIRNLLELGPDKVSFKRAVCETCKRPEAVYTQLLEDGKPITEGVPSVVPEDGRYEYLPVCRKCFIKIS